MAWIGAAAQVVSSGINAYSQNSASNANAKDFRKMRGWLSNLAWYGDRATTSAEQYLSRVPKLIDTGYAQARRGLTATGAQAKQGIADRGTQQLAASSQSAASRGLYNTTALDAASRGIHADTSRALAGVDESIGQMLSNLELNKVGAKASAYSALSNFQLQKYQNKRLGIMDLVDLYTGNKSQPSTITGLGDLASSLKGIKWGELFGPSDPYFAQGPNQQGPPKPSGL